MERADIIGRILGQNGGKWLQFARRVLRNRADAEDVLQDAVQRALGCKRDFSTDDEARKYLARIVTNLSFEIYKNRKRERNRQVCVDDDFPSVSGIPTPDAQLEQQENEIEESTMLSALNEALNRLPPREYQALRITVMDCEGSSIREAGASSGIPFSTLRHRRIEGLRRLRKYMHRALRLRRNGDLPILSRE